ncbi:hypothetical protein CYMTET_13936 [Cymbomonas tetramitiformis]|uniref:COP9 signalosome complex subunit 6 n=1 Tax=Cymbomonas tetramitiformis TaxID=36881 RepID=A0AAE0GHC8_9CHLO|nr:hypothetical protein CYMTET_13936 [Cymbomonas tetramitiformis]
MANNSGLIFKLHPLVLINVSDHFTRIRVQKGAAERVLGCLIGIQTGREVEITNSFEIKFEIKDSATVLDLAYLGTKQEQYKKVFPKCDVIGWYSTGCDLVDEDMQIHKSMTAINESPVLLLLNPSIGNTDKELPIKIFESELHVIDGVPSLIFAESNYTIETVEAERIAVDQIARIQPSGNGTNSTQLTTHLTGMHSAIKMLHSRIQCITQYLEEVSRGEKPYDHALLRQVASLTRQLPAVDTSKFQDEFLMEYNDALLMTHLATMTKGVAAINELADRFNVAYDKHGRRKGFYSPGLLQAAP